MGTVIAIVQERNGSGLDYSIIRGCSQKLSEPRNILKVEVTELRDALDVR